MQWVAGDRVWSFSPFLRYFALGNWKEAYTGLAKLIRSLGMGTFTSSGYQARVSTWRAHHFTHPWGHQRVVWVLQIGQVCPLCHWMSLSPTGTHACMGKKLVGLPDLLWQIETSLQFHQNCQRMRHHHPLPWAQWDPTSLWSHLSCFMERKSDLLLLGRPVCHLEGCLQARIQTCVFKGDPPL